MNLKEKAFDPSKFISEDFLLILNEHRKNCEREGKLEQASMARKRLKELRIFEENKRKDETFSRHVSVYFYKTVLFFSLPTDWLWQQEKLTPWMCLSIVVIEAGNGIAGECTWFRDLRVVEQMEQYNTTVKWKWGRPDRDGTEKEVAVRVRWFQDLNWKRYRADLEITFLCRRHWDAKASWVSRLGWVLQGR